MTTQQEPTPEGARRMLVAFVRRIAQQTEDTGIYKAEPVATPIAREARKLLARIGMGGK